MTAPQGLPISDRAREGEPAMGVDVEAPAMDGGASTPAVTTTSPALGQAAGAGLTWMVGVMVLNKLLTFVAQWVLGLKLSSKEFSLYATATAVAGFTMICREAGMRELLVQRGPNEYERLAGPAFWLAVAYNVIVAVVMVGVGWALGAYRGEPALAWMLWVMAVALPIGTMGGILQNKLRLDMQFRVFSLKAAMSNLARQLSSIAFAMAGFGAMSFAWPVLVCAFVESIGGYTATRDKIWKRRAEPRTWPGLLRDSKWLMFASIAAFSQDYGPFLILSPIMHVPDDVNGVFFFAFMITGQVGVLLGWSVILVLVPVLTRLNNEPERQTGAAIRALRTLMLVASIACLGLASVMAPLEGVLWRGKWGAAVAPVVIMGLFFPWRVTFGLTSSLMMAQGRFKRYAWLTLVEGVGFTLACGLGALVEQSAIAIAWAGGAWLCGSRVVLNIWLFRDLGVSPWGVCKATLPPWLVAIVAAACGIAADRWLGAPLSGGLPTRWGDLVRVAIAGGVCGVTFLMLTRAFLGAALRDALAVTPARVRPLAARLVGIRPESIEAM
jgi:O-antigen/teichoic acid export membrane protein